MKTFILIDKSTGKVVYGGQSFQADASPVGLLGGAGQTSWYWLDITGASPNLTKTFTPTTPPAADVANAVILNANGSWA